MGRSRWRLVALGAVAGLVVGGGGVGAAWAASGSGSSSAKSFTLRGALDLEDATDLTPEATSCAGTGGYDDIVEGASVTVYDAAGAVVAEGALGAGSRAKAGYDDSPCRFAVTVPGVPAGSKFYSVEVSHRGKLTVSAADAQAGRFTATLG
ncbi:hypothetical protein [Actinacidiphila sp. bgisy145]|uniref:hypothetical protein n=1 Tax=Actinacidiphila sp. bgisy145 TaxID=3413792 RepID=UPI003EBE0CDD